MRSGEIRASGVHIARDSAAPNVVRSGVPSRASTSTEATSP